MKIVLKIVSLLALLLTVLPSILFLMGSVELKQVKLLMLIATIVWFVVTPLWMWKKEDNS